MARPKVLNPKKIAKEINVYVEEHDLPFVANICTDLGLTKSWIYDNIPNCKELEDSIKKANQKCEANILQKSLTGIYNGSVGIFLLKNYGWTDKAPEETDNTVKVEIVNAEDYTN